MKIWMLADAKTGYCYNAQMYLGQQAGGREVGQGRRVVLDLVQPIQNSGRNVTCDQFFTSYSLATSLLERGLTLLGTLNRQRKEVPIALRPNRVRDVHTSIFCHSNDNVMLVSYVPRRGKAVVLLSTMHSDHSLLEDKNLPELIHDYNQTKGGVDVCNKLVRTYSVKRKTRRWPLTLFFNSLDLSAVKSLIIWLLVIPCGRQTSGDNGAVSTCVNWLKHSFKDMQQPASLNAREPFDMVKIEGDALCERHSRTFPRFTASVIFVPETIG